MIRQVVAKFRQFFAIMNGLQVHLQSDAANRGVELQLQHYRDWLFLNHPRYRDHRALAPFGNRVYSQTDEDGILAEIFARLGVTTGTFIEFGVEDGMETNSTVLMHAGWKGIWLEGSPEYAASIRKTFSVPLADGRLKIRECFITAENIEEVLLAEGAPPEPTLLCVDIDGNDYWVWQAITKLRPQVVVVEYNGDFGPSVDWVMKYDPTHRFAGTRYYGASLKAFERLGTEKGYSLVGCNFHGMNAFFVRNDLLGDKFLAPFTAETHYEPPRHFAKPRSGWGKDAREFSTSQAARVQATKS
jgi:hypothetical protein